MVHLFIMLLHDYYMNIIIHLVMVFIYKFVDENLKSGFFEKKTSKVSIDNSFSM
jgi:hypothetical protein